MTKKNINSNLKKQKMLKGLLGVAFSSSISNLPSTQIEILYYLCVEFINIPKIANIRKTSPQAVRKVVCKLRKKGLINSKNLPNKEVEIGGGSYSDNPQNEENLFRLHGQAMTIKILKTFPKFMKLLNNKSQVQIKNNTIMLYGRKLVIYSKTSFYNKIIDECFIRSNDYWTQFYRIVESELGVALINNQKTSLYQFRCHIAKTNDPLAKKVIKANLKYEVIDDLGQLRLIIDNSKGLFEKEAVHKDLCADDMKKISNFELDVITKDGLLPSEAKEWVEGMKNILELKQEQDNENTLRITGLIRINKVLEQRITYLEGLLR